LNVFDKTVRFSDVEYGGNGDKTQFICGYLLCDQRFNPLLGAMPELIILSPQKERLIGENPELLPLTISIVSDSWLDMTFRHLIEEVKGKIEGSNTIATRLTETMYVEVLRRYMKELPEESRGWLAAVRDPEVGMALRYLHAHPDEKWHVEDLAAKVGVSRSAFTKRFRELIGEPPIQYLTTWRVQLAKNLLFQPDLSMAMIAEKVGYDSDIAFNRAFKRNVGEPPARWREHATVNFLK
jgi:AraC-like DNA-binding protein